MVAVVAVVAVAAVVAVVAVAAMVVEPRFGSRIPRRNLPKLRWP